MIAVPATPARTIASRTARTRGSTRARRSRRGGPARRTGRGSSRPAGPARRSRTATVETSSGNQQRRSAKRNWPTNSPPYGYGGRRADTIVFPVRDHHVPDFFEQVLRRKECSIGDAADHAISTSPLATLGCACHAGHPLGGQSMRPPTRLPSRNPTCSRVPPALVDTSLLVGSRRSEGSRRALRATCVAAIVAAAALSRAAAAASARTKNETAGTYKVEVVKADVPEQQRLANQATMRIVVRNAADETIPNVAVTITPTTSQGGAGFTTRSDGRRPRRPDAPAVDRRRGPARRRHRLRQHLGARRAGRRARRKTFEWHVTPVVAGTHSCAGTSPPASTARPRPGPPTAGRRRHLPRPRREQARAGRSRPEDRRHRQRRALPTP